MKPSNGVAPPGAPIPRSETPAASAAERAIFDARVALLFGDDPPANALAPGCPYAAAGRQAADFAGRYAAAWQPDWWFNLCSMPADGGPPDGRSWQAGTLALARDDMSAWIADRNRAGRGVYFTVNPLARSVEGKPRGEDVAAFVALHIDADPTPEAHGGYAAAREVLWRSVGAWDAEREGAPSFVVDSGNGAGLFFMLGAPELDLARGAQACKALQARAGALMPGVKVDGTADAARLMRLPFPRNWPGERKRAKGYPAGDASPWASLRLPWTGATLAPEAVAALAGQEGTRERQAAPVGPQERHRAPSAERLAALVADMPNPASIDRNKWVGVLWAIRASAGGLLPDDGQDIARAWSDRWEESADPDNFERTWKSLEGASQKGWPELVEDARGFGSTVAGMESAVLDFAGVVSQIVAPPPRGRFRLWTMDDCAASPTRGYIIKGVLAPGDLAILYGPPGAGKSALAPYLAHAVATGREVFTRRVRACPVLYIAAEDGHGMRGRLRALCAKHGHPPGLFLIAEALDLGNPGDVKAIQACIAECGAELVIVDTLAAAFPGLKENESEDMGRAVAALRALSKPTGAAVLLLHHGTKGGDRGPRGHSLLNGAADVTLELAPPNGKVRSVTLGKNRNGPSDGFTLHFAVEAAPIGLDSDGDVETAAIAVETPGVRRAPKLPKAGQTALTALRSLLAARGKALPLGDGYPAEATRGIDVGAWRAECDRVGLSGAEVPKDRTKAFNRAKDALRGAGVIDLRDDMVWLKN